MLLIGSLLLCVTSVQASVSKTNSDSSEARLTQLERISNAQAQLLTQFQQQLSDLQRDIDTLRGQVQEVQYRLNQAIEKQKHSQQQTGNLEGQGALTSGGAVITESEAQSGKGSAVSVVKEQDSNENNDYSIAVALAIDKKQYDQAISAFRDFVKRYPASNYQPNANYWLGQLYYNKGNKDDATYHYAVVVKNYPKSPKRPDSMLKVGIIMQEKGQLEKARAVYQQVIKWYPDTEMATQAKKQLEKLQAS